MKPVVCKFPAMDTRPWPAKKPEPDEEKVRPTSGMPTSQWKCPRNVPFNETVLLTTAKAVTALADEPGSSPEQRTLP
jgi:hypothetical protein